jgi:prepilin-type processing-associated H-X9-DG protein
MGTPPLPGCSENHGINNPLQSPHPGGLLIGMADGSVRFRTHNANLAFLLRAAIRNDGPLDIPD